MPGFDDFRLFLAPWASHNSKYRDFFVPAIPSPKAAPPLDLLFQTASAHQRAKPPLPPRWVVKYLSSQGQALSLPEPNYFLSLSASAVPS